MATTPNQPFKAVYAQPETTVIAVQTRTYDPPQCVAETIEDLRSQFPGTWSGNQCDSCGCVAYMIERDTKFDSDTVFGWSARCCGDADEAAQAEDWAAKAQTPESRRGHSHRLRSRLLAAVR